MKFTTNNAPKHLYYAHKCLCELPVLAAVDDQGAIGFLGFVRVNDDFESILKRYWPNVHLVHSSTHCSGAFSQLQAFLENRPTPFEVIAQGTPLQLKVWQTLLSIPKGQCVDYSWVAQKTGNPKAVRAVASAIGKNPVSVLVPCHRVLRKDGNLGGYAWGLDIKQKLLSLEGININSSIMES